MGGPSRKPLQMVKENLIELNEVGINNPRTLLTNCIYLEDNQIEVYGYKIFGTPWQPEHRGWAFGLPRGHQLLEKWNKIPSETDILLSHGPPLGHGDLSVKTGTHEGCVELLNSIENRIKPKYHIFGHIHEGYGCTTNGETIFINASICDDKRKACNDPIIFDLPLKNGHRK